MVSRPTVLLLIPHLGGGGAERVMELLARGLSPEKFDVHLCLITQRDASGILFPASVTIHGVGARRVRDSAYRLLCLVRRLKPGIVLSGMFHLNYLVILLRPLFPAQTRVLIRHNGAMSAGLAGSSARLHWRRLLCRLLYPRADGIVCQTRTMRDDFASLLGSNKKLHVLQNPVNVEAIRRVMGSAPRRWVGAGPHLLAIGRLCREKGFDLLLEAFADVRVGHVEADLTIVGAGIEEANLRAQCRALGLDGRVRFAGQTSQPESWFAGASVFVLSSREEGLPNVLLEAAAAGLPIVALPAIGGVAELLSGRFGVWVAQEITAAALATSLLEALKTLRQEERFVHEWVEDFRMERAILGYEGLIDATLNGTVS